MKPRRSTLMLAALAALLIVALPAHAQFTETMRANVPFAFVVGDTTLPAGEYEVRTIDQNDPATFVIYDDDGTEVMFKTVDSQEQLPGERPELVFNVMNDTAWLHEINVPSHGLGREVLDDDADAEEHAGHEMETRTVTLVLID